MHWHQTGWMHRRVRARRTLLTFISAHCIVGSPAHLRVKRACVANLQALLARIKCPKGQHLNLSTRKQKTFTRFVPVHLHPHSAQLRVKRACVAKFQAQLARFKSPSRHTSDLFSRQRKETS